jgi:hypothetical protein
MVTDTPPASGPLAALTPVTVGAPAVVATKVYSSAGSLTAEVPLGFVTVTSTLHDPDVQIKSAAVTAVIEVALLTVKLAAAVAPKSTTVAPVKFVPVMVTDDPPDAVPELGLTPVTVGNVALKVYSSPEPELAVPAGVVTLIWTLPADSAGVTAVIWVSLLTVKLVAPMVPKSTTVAPLRPVPVITICVPPAVVPVVGVKEAIAGDTVPKVNSSADEPEAEVSGEIPFGVMTLTSTTWAGSAGLVAVI